MGQRLHAARAFATGFLLLASCGLTADDTPTAARGENVDPFSQPFKDAEAYPVIASSEIVVGRNRLLVGLLNDQDAPIGSPRIRMSIDFFDLERSTSEPVTSADMGFIWVDKPYRGLYKQTVSFPSAGRWGAEVTIEGDGIDETLKSSFEVRNEPSTPALGSRPPATDTPTSAGTGDLTKISTDENPDPRFYRTSIAGALRAGRPFVVAFATPKFCASATCGPTLDVVKKVARSFPEVTFIHVEPYRLPADPANLEPVEAALEWGLPSEPWVFVVDGRGRVSAKYEGVLASGELRRELTRLTNPVVN